MKVMSLVRLTQVTQQKNKWMCDALRDLVPCLQFKKREKHPWRSVTSSSLQPY